MKVREDSEKAGLKLTIQKTKIMASSPITSWQIDGETVETLTDFIFLGSKIIASGPSQERTGESGAFGMWPHPRGSRSEEHTSELQSP